MHVFKLHLNSTQITQNRNKIRRAVFLSLHLISKSKYTLLQDLFTVFDSVVKSAGLWGNRNTKRIHYIKSQ